MSLEARIAELELRHQRVQQDLNRLPLYLPPVPQTRIVRILGGNLQNGVGTIKYVAAALAPTTLYDPAVDTVYLDGLGYGDVYTPGSLSPTRRLVCNNYAGFADSILAGDAWLVGGEIVITVASGPSAGQTMRAVTIRRG